MRMRYIISSVACPAVLYFYKLSYKQYDFGKKVIEYNMCVLIFFTPFVWNKFFLRTEQEMNKNVYSY